MQVRDLIESLQSVNPDAWVIFYDSSIGETRSIYRIEEGMASDEVLLSKDDYTYDYGLPVLVLREQF